MASTPQAQARARAQAQARPRGPWPGDGVYEDPSGPLFYFQSFADNTIKVFDLSDGDGGEEGGGTVDGATALLNIFGNPDHSATYFYDYLIWDDGDRWAKIAAPAGPDTPAVADGRPVGAAGAAAADAPEDWVVDLWVNSPTPSHVDPPSRTASSSPGKAKTLELLKNLRETSMLTADEYEAKVQAVHEGTFASWSQAKSLLEVQHETSYSALEHEAEVRLAELRSDHAHALERVHADHRAAVGSAVSDHRAEVAEMRAVLAEEQRWSAALERDTESRLQQLRTEHAAALHSASVSAEERIAAAVSEVEARLGAEHEQELRDLQEEHELALGEADFLSGIMPGDDDTDNGEWLMVEGDQSNALMLRALVAQRILPRTLCKLQQLQGEVPPMYDAVAAAAATSTTESETQSHDQHGPGWQSSKLELGSAFEEQLAAAEARLHAEHEAEIAAMTAAHTSVVEGMQEKQAAAKARNKALRGELETKTAELGRHVTLLAQLESAATDTAAGAREELRSELSADIARLQTELATANEETAALRKNTADSGSRMANKDGEIAKLTDEVARLQSEMNVARSELATASETAAVLQQQVDDSVEAEADRQSVYQEQQKLKVSADQVERLFRTIDFDHGGGLSLEEFKLACLLATGSMTEGELENLFKELDEDGSGEIDIGEFRTGFEKLRQRFADDATQAAALKVSHTKQNAELVKLSADVARLQTELSCSRSEHERQTAAAVERYAAETEQLRQQLAAAHEEQLAAAKAAHESAVVSHKALIDSLSEDHTATMSEVQDLHEAALAAAKEAALSAQGQHDAAAQSLRSELDASSGRGAQLSEQLAELQTRFTEMIPQIEQRMSGVHEEKISAVQIRLRESHSEAITEVEGKHLEAVRQWESRLLSTQEEGRVRLAQAAADHQQATDVLKAGHAAVLADQQEAVLAHQASVEAMQEAASVSAAGNQLSIDALMAQHKAEVAGLEAMLEAVEIQKQAARVTLDTERAKYEASQLELGRTLLELEGLREATASVVTSMVVESLASNEAETLRMQEELEASQTEVENLRSASSAALTSAVVDALLEDQRAELVGEEENVKLQARLLQQEDHAVEQRTELVGLSEALEQQKRCLTERAEEHTKTKQELDVVKGKGRQAEEKLVEVQAHLLGLAPRVEQYMASLRADSSESQAQTIETLRQQKQATAAKLDDLQARLGVVVPEMQGHVEELQAKHAATLQELELSKGESRSAFDKLETLQARLAEMGPKMEEQVEDLEKQHAVAQQELQLEVNAANRRTRSVSETLGELQERFAAMGPRMEAQIAEMQAEHAKTVAELDSTKRQSSAAAARLKAVQTRLADVAPRAAEAAGLHVDKTKEAAQRELDSANTRCRSLSNELEVLQERMAGMEEDNRSAVDALATEWAQLLRQIQTQSQPDRTAQSSATTLAEWDAVLMQAAAAGAQAQNVADFPSGLQPDSTMQRIEGLAFQDEASEETANQ
eukprot:SAG22_NODE_24_length_30194_cov_6.086327_2_plen_1485_part_00